MIGYRYAVTLFNENSVTKQVWRVNVLSMTKSYCTIDDYGSKIRVPRKLVRDTQEEAEQECEAAANELIAKLVQRITDLKEPAHFSDRVPQRNTEL